MICPSSRQAPCLSSAQTRAFELGLKKQRVLSMRKGGGGAVLLPSSPDVELVLAHALRLASVLPWLE